VRRLLALLLALPFAALAGEPAPAPEPVPEAAPEAAPETSPGRAPTGWALFSSCAGNCAVALYGGPYVDKSMAQVLYQEPELPFSWDYRGSDGIVALAFSRHAATLFGRIDLEPEIGIGQRLGRQTETELWAALYARWRGFPWDRVVTTTFAVSTGLNYATGISDVEREKAEDKGNSGNRLLHFFSPEITFALPDRPEIELLFRFHHRSGANGLVGDPGGGSHYGTVGLRWRF
jgi:hypothetical protein